MTPDYSLKLNYPHNKKFVGFCLQSISLVALFITMLASAQSAYAQLPVDPHIVHGNADIDAGSNHMSITNSPNTIINWQDFSIGHEQSVEFLQQNADSQVLNRVVGNDPSEIFGGLRSNGGVWLINPHGVLFGEGARIDVGGLVASTLDISNLDFLAKNYHFNAIDNGSGNVLNQGEIRTSLGGRVWMTSEQVQNEGLIQSPQGHVVLAAGKSIELIDSGAPNVVVRVSAPENEAVNLGTLVATNGQVDVHGSIINQQGIIRADSLTTDTSGRIVLQANDTLTLAENSLTQAGEVSLRADRLTYLGGEVDVSNSQGAGGNIQLNTGKLEGMAGGTLRADGEQGGHIRVEGRDLVAFSSTLEATGNTQGGKIEVTGDSVILLNADVDASGGTQGGTVHVGGGWQGGGDLPHAREVIVGVGSEVKANGNASGGEVAIWSTQSSEHYGSLQAKDGGRIELSSMGEIRQTGDIQVGPDGTVLLNPKDLIITDNPPSGPTLARKVVANSVNGQPILASDDQLGFAVALDGDRLAIGAINDVDSTNTGSVDLFTGVGTDFSGLTWRKKLASGIGAFEMPNFEPGGGFGSAIALDGDHLAIGAPRADDRTGAVYLFNGVGNDFSGLTHHLESPLENGTVLVGTGPNDTEVINLDSRDFFGSSVALDGDRLAIGASRDDGRNNSTSEGGAVYLFSGVGTNFSNLMLQRVLDDTASFVNNNEGFNINNGDLFGRSVALDGDRLVVGAPGGNPDSDTNEGKVYLFSGVGTDFSALDFRYEFSVDHGMPDLSVGDGFGFSVALRNNHLLVGAPGDGDGTGELAPGIVYLFSGADANFASRPVLTQEISALNLQGEPEFGGLFGGSVAIDGDRIAIGSYSQALSDSNVLGRGAVYLFNGLSTLPLNITNIDDVRFNVNPGATSYIAPSIIEAILNTGSDVTLQANNDILVQSEIESSCNIGFCNSDLMLHAGRNITFGANINAEDVDFTAIAGHAGANTSFRDPGTPTITIDNNASLSIGEGTATLAAIDGNFINHNGDDAILTAADNSGRWVIYAANPEDSIEGFSNFNKHFNQPYSENIPDYANSGNWFLYSAPPKIPPGPDGRTPAEVVSVSVNEIGIKPSSIGGVDWVPPLIPSSEIPWRIYKKLSNRYLESGFPELAILFSKLAVESIRELNTMNDFADELKMHEQLVMLLLDQERYIEARFDALRMLKELEYRYYSVNEISLGKEMQYNPAESKYSEKVAGIVNDFIVDNIDEWLLNDQAYQEQTLSYQPSTHDALEYVKLAANRTAEIMDDSNNQMTRGVKKSQDLGRTGHAIIPQEHSIEEISKHIKEIGHIDEIEAELKKAGKYLNELKTRGRVRGALKKMADNLDEKTTLLFHLLFDEKLIILVYSPHIETPDTIIEVPIKRSELNNHIYTLRKELKKPDGFNNAPIGAEILYNYLIAPVKAELDKRNPKTLAIYQTNALRYMPYSALHDGDKYLIQDYALTSYLEGNIGYTVSDQRSDHWNIAGFGVSESLNKEFKNLPAVIYELKEIGVLPDNTFLNNDFTKDQLVNAIDNADIQVIHIASHFKLGSSFKNSFLLVGNGTTIRTEDFKKLEMYEKELLTLSACETALGNLTITENNGKEVESLAITLFRETAANAVLATLWSVADESTAIFMEQFYRFRGQHNLSKAEAIRQTQLLFINGGNISDGVGSEGQGDGFNRIKKNYVDPFYWAPFTLMGNWL